MSSLMVALVVAVLAAVFAGAFAAWFQCNLGAERKRRRRFEDRETLPFDAWYARYYGDEEAFPPSRVRAILEMFAEEIGVKRTQFRPEDRLYVDFPLGSSFAVDRCWLEWSEELQELSAEWGGPELELSPDWETLDDLIRGVVGQHE